MGKKPTQNAPFVPFCDMRVVTFVLPDEMADALIGGLQWFILIPRLSHTMSTMVIWESSQWLGKNIVWSLQHG